MSKAIEYREQAAAKFKAAHDLVDGKDVDDLSADEFVANMKAVKGLHQSATALAKEMKLDGGDTATLASVGEFLLEGLYVNNRLGKFNSKGKTFFRK